VNVSGGKASHSLGIASLVLGVLSFFVCWIPFIGFFFSGLGFLLGVVGLCLALARKGSGIGFAIAGTAVSSVGVVAGLIFVIFLAGVGEAFRQASDAVSKTQQRSSGEIETIEDSITVDDDAATPNEKAHEEERWAPATEPVTLEGVTITIAEARVGKVPLLVNYSNEEGVSEDVLLAVTIEVLNTSKTKKLEYRSYTSALASLEDIFPHLTDDKENRYKRITFGIGLAVKDAQDETSLYPGKSLRDVIVFEAPVEGIKWLRFGFPAQSFGETGDFRFEIPRDMIKRP
jgi:hypothetical protein